MLPILGIFLCMKAIVAFIGICKLDAYGLMEFSRSFFHVQRRVRYVFKQAEADL